MLWFANGKPRGGGLTRRGRMVLAGLDRREARLEQLVKRIELATERARAEIAEQVRQLEWELEQARETIRKYETETEGLRDQLAVRDQTIEAQQAEHRRIVETIRAGTSEAIARQRLGLPARDDD